MPVSNRCIDILMRRICSAICISARSLAAERGVCGASALGAHVGASEIAVQVGMVTLSGDFSRKFAKRAGGGGCSTSGANGGPRVFPSLSSSVWPSPSVFHMMNGLNVFRALPLRAKDRLRRTNGVDTRASNMTAPRTPPTMAATGICLWPVDVCTGMLSESVGTDVLPVEVVTATPPRDVEAGTLTVDTDTEGVKLGFPEATSPVAVGTDMLTVTVGTAVLLPKDVGAGRAGVVGSATELEVPIGLGSEVMTA